eukprot:1677325-Pyramimonas_sp.AAC.1
MDSYGLLWTLVQILDVLGQRAVYLRPLRGVPPRLPNPQGARGDALPGALGRHGQRDALRAGGVPPRCVQLRGKCPVRDPLQTPI